MKRFLRAYWPIIFPISAIAIAVPVILFCNWRVMMVVGVVLFFGGAVLSALWMTKQQKKQLALLPSSSNDDKLLEWAERVNTKLEDVAGCDEAKEEVSTVIDFLKNPEKYSRLGGRVPRGILLVGGTGTGKTLLARAVAGEADVPFAFMNGSQFVKIFVGNGAARVRQAFAEARKKAPCILFIDEIDGGGGARQASALHQEYNQTVNALLAEMDGFKDSEPVLVMAATNRPDALDPALLRAGRLDKRVIVPMPDVQGREQILRVHAKKIKLSERTNFGEVARLTSGLPGSELANIINHAAIIAAKRGADAVEQEDLINGIDTALYGSPMKSRIVPEKERLTAAYHEAGHTIVAKFLKEADPVHKVTIIPRGLSGGATHFTEEDKTSKTESYLKARIAVSMGGRQAEMIKFGEPSNGATGDFLNATDLAKKMVCEYGMSKRVGSRVFKVRNEFLGFSDPAVDCSPEMQRVIDEEIKRILDGAEEAAKDILETQKTALEALAQELLKKETLSAKEVDEIIKLASA